MALNSDGVFASPGDQWCVRIAPLMGVADREQVRRRLVDEMDAEDYFEAPAAAREVEAPSAAAGIDISVLGDEWREVRDEAKGRSYWYSRTTRESRWRLPAEAVQVPVGIDAFGIPKFRYYALSSSAFKTPRERGGGVAATINDGRDERTARLSGKEGMAVGDGTGPGRGGGEATTKPLSPRAEGAVTDRTRSAWSFEGHRSNGGGSAAAAARGQQSPPAGYPTLFDFSRDHDEAPPSANGFEGAEAAAARDGSSAVDGSSAIDSVGVRSFAATEIGASEVRRCSGSSDGGGNGGSSGRDGSVSPPRRGILFPEGDTTPRREQRFIVHRSTTFPLAPELSFVEADGGSGDDDGEGDGFSDGGCDRDNGGSGCNDGGAADSGGAGGGEGGGGVGSGSHSSEQGMASTSLPRRPVSGIPRVLHHAEEPVMHKGMAPFSSTAMPAEGTTTGDKRSLAVRGSKVDGPNRGDSSSALGDNRIGGSPASGGGTREKAPSGSPAAVPAMAAAAAAAASTVSSAAATSAALLTPSPSIVADSPRRRLFAEAAVAEPSVFCPYCGECFGVSLLAPHCGECVVLERCRGGRVHRCVQAAIRGGSSRGGGNSNGGSSRGGGSVSAVSAGAAEALAPVAEEAFASKAVVAPTADVAVTVREGGVGGHAPPAPSATQKAAGGHLTKLDINGARGFLAELGVADESQVSDGMGGSGVGSDDSVESGAGSGGRGSRVSAAAAMEQCSECLRTFAPGRIEAHRRVCRRVFLEKRPVFDGKQKRIRGTLLEFAHMLATSGAVMAPAHGMATGGAETAAGSTAAATSPPLRINTNRAKDDALSGKRAAGARGGGGGGGGGSSSSIRQKSHANISQTAGVTSTARAADATPAAMAASEASEGSLGSPDRPVAAGAAPVVTSDCPFCKRTCRRDGLSAHLLSCAVLKQQRAARQRDASAASAASAAKPSSGAAAPARCPHCFRSFAAAAAPHHVVICAKVENRPRRWRAAVLAGSVPRAAAGTQR